MKEETVLLYSDYLDGNLSDDERRAFEERLQKEEHFAQDFELFREVYKVLENQHSEERSDFIKSLELINAEYRYTPEKEETPKNSKSFRIWQMGIAASILLVVGFFVFNQFSKPSYTDYAPLDQIELSVRSTNLEAAKKAETNFNTANYKEALIYIDELLEAAPDNAELKYYKARALVELDEDEQALPLLKELSDGKSVYADKATYLWGLTYLKDKDYDQAQEILERIPEGSEEYDLAQRIISKL